MIYYKLITFQDKIMDRAKSIMDQLTTVASDKCFTRQVVNQFMDGECSQTSHSHDGEFGRQCSEYMFRKALSRCGYTELSCQVQHIDSIEYDKILKLAWNNEFGKST